MNVFHTAEPPRIDDRMQKSSRTERGQRHLPCVILIVAVLVGFGSVGSANGQESVVSGTVMDHSSGTPVAGARVTLERGGALLSTTVTDTTGHFVISGTGAPGELSVSQMGMTTWTRELSETGDVDLGTIRLRAAPIALEGLEASGESRCDANPQDLATAYELIDRIRPSLRQIVANDHREDLEYVVEVARMVRHPPPLGAFRSTWTRDTMLVRFPFAMPAHEPATLHSEGFAVALSDTVNEYRAPNAAWLASDGFPESYCLSAVEGDEGATEGEGIRFWPKSESGKVDISGTIWLSPDGGPTAVDFRYTSLATFVEIHELPLLVRAYQIRENTILIPMHRVRVDEEDHGGRLTFSEVADGVWMTSAWTIRGAWLADRAHYEMGRLDGVWPRTEPLLTSGRLVALIPKDR